MPYKNIVFVKLLWKQLLFEDRRFTEDLNDEQKGLYLMLILLAGATSNNIPSDPQIIKRMLNLESESTKIYANLQKIMTHFPKLVGNSQSYKFKNFNTLHNYIRQPVGNPSDVPDKNRIEKNRLDKIRTCFCDHYRQKVNSSYLWSYGKENRIIKDLLITLKDEEVIELIGLFFQSDNDFIKKAGYTVGVFKSQINKLRVVKPISRGDAWKYNSDGSLK